MFYGFESSSMFCLTLIFSIKPHSRVVGAEGAKRRRFPGMCGFRILKTAIKPFVLYISLQIFEHIGNIIKIGYGLR